MVLYGADFIAIDVHTAPDDRARCVLVLDEPARTGLQREPRKIYKINNKAHQ